MAQVLWVSGEVAHGSGNGTKDRPYSCIQDAIDAAQPGAVIKVAAGTYEENLRFGSGGTEANPITLVSADGPGAAVIRPAEADKDTLRIAGADHIVVDGFTLHGSSDDTRQVIHIHGVDGGQDRASNIVISNNVIHRGAGDGIKGSKAEGLTLIGNTITGGGKQESGIDFVGVDHAMIDGNTLTDLGFVGIMIKGGSSDIQITGNHIRNTGHNAIEVGGYTKPEYYPPGFLEAGGSFEAGMVLLSGNTITDSGNSAVRLIGAQQVLLMQNTINGDGAVVKIDESAKFHDDPWISDLVGFFENEIANDDWLKNRSEASNIFFDAEALAQFADWLKGPNAPVAEADEAEVAATVQIDGTDQKDQLTGTAKADAINGYAGNDRIGGGEGDDTLDGGAGRDDLRGEDDDDLLLGYGGRDKLNGGDGNDTLVGGGDRDKVIGGKGDDALSGDAGNDDLRGGNGADTLSGGAGNDQLRGGRDADTFVFLASTGIGKDRVRDFDTDEDTLVFEGFGTALDGFDDLDSNGDGRLTGQDIWVTISGGDTFLDLSGNGALPGGQQMIRIDATGLSAGDFDFLA